LYLVARAGRASFAAVSALARGNRVSALNSAVEVAFALGYAAGSWRMTGRAAEGAVSAATEAA
jgi:hypothetical protein